MNSCLDLNFELIKKADKSGFANGNNIRLNNLGPIALFSLFKSTTLSSKHLEDISHVHIVSIMYKLITSAKDSEDLSIVFDGSRDRRKRKLTNNKNLKGKNLLRIMLKDIFGFAEHRKKATNGLNYKLTLTRNKDDAIMDKTMGIADARIRIGNIHWRIPHYTPSIQEQGILSEQILNKTPTEFRYVERSLFMEEDLFKICGISI